VALSTGAWVLPTFKQQLDWGYKHFPRLSERQAQSSNILSGRERQMFALGRALMSRPRLLMLDEPSPGLAPLIVAETLAMVRPLCEGGVSILLVEQNAMAALNTSRITAMCWKPGRSCCPASRLR
jgi:branched-chain amino acid transport system ATP-binding protein